MSNEIVNYEDKLAALAKAASKTERPAGANIGTRAGVLTYNGTPIPGNKLDVIVLASVHANTFYEGAFDPQNMASPVCFAYAEDGENMVPHPASTNKQSDNCASCPKNQWNSDPKGGKGKACKNSRSLAVIPAGTKPADVATCEIAVLRPPVTSVKNWQMYVQKCGALYARPPLAVLTQVGTVPDQTSQFKLTFTDTGVVDNAMVGPLLDRVPYALEVAQKIYEPNVKQEDPKNAKAKKF